MPGVPGCSPRPSPNLPTRGRQRLAVSAPTLHGCHRVPATTPGLRGGPWAVWGPYPPCIAHVHCRSPGVCMGWPTVGGWRSSTAHLGLCGKSRGRAWSCLAGFFCVRKRKDIVGLHFFDLNEISVLCQGWMRPVMVLCPLAEDNSVPRDTVLLLLAEDRSWRVLSLTTLFRISPNHQPLPIVKQRSPKGKAEGFPGIFTKVILGNGCLSMDLGKAEKSCRCRDSAQQSWIQGNTSVSKYSWDQAPGSQAPVTALSS